MAVAPAACGSSSFGSMVLGMVPIVVLGLVVGLVLSLLVDVCRCPRARGVPGPWSLPLLDQSLELHRNRHRFLSWLLDYSQRFEGRTWTFKVGSGSAVWLVEEEEEEEELLRGRGGREGRT